MLGAPRRAEAAEESVTALANSIERIAGDDVLITKIALNYIEELENQLNEGQNPPYKFFEDIIRAHWPKYEHTGSKSEVMIIDFPEPEGTEESKTEQEMMDQYLAKIQKVRGKKVKGEELTVLCKSLAQATETKITKKSWISKTRMLQWIVKNQEAIQPKFEEVLAAWAAGFGN